MGLKVKLVKLDRGFYSGEVIDELELKGMNYLIFAKKSSIFKCMLEGTQKSVIVKHEIKYKKDKSSHKAQTSIVLVKNVNEYDWVFATNLFLRDARKYVELYMARSEEHTSELQSQFHLVCRLLLEKKPKRHTQRTAWPAATQPPPASPRPAPA